MALNPFHGTDLFLCPLKTSGNPWFSDVFQGVKTNQCHEIDIFNKWDKAFKN